jgi:hypothetical protein
MSDAFEILLGDVNDVEAHVIARYRGSEPTDAPVQLGGTLRGPYCESSRTLPAEFTFQSTQSLPPNVDHGKDASRNKATAKAVVPDPCLWSPELPHLYQADLEARVGARVIARYHGSIGLRRTSPRRQGIAFPG